LSAPRKATGKLTYCLTCKDDTETVLYRVPGIWGMLGEKRRICRTCAKPKAVSKLEVEE